MNLKLKSTFKQQPRIEIKPQSESLATALRLMRNRKKMTTLVQVDHAAPYPLSYAQESLWLFQQKHPESTDYNTVHAFQLRGALNISALERTVNEIIHRHAILRTVYGLESVPNGEIRDELQPVQRILPFCYRPLTLIDLQNLDEDVQVERYQTYLREVSELPFDLSQDETMRVALLQLGEDEFIFVYSIHHISYDAPSERILFRELSTLYQNFCDDSLSTSSSLPDINTHYIDFAAWQRETLSEEKLELKIARHAEILASVLDDDEMPVVDLPKDGESASGVQVRTEIIPLDPSLTEGLQQLSQQSGFSLFNIMLATFYVLLSRYTGQENLLVGTTVTNRSQAALNRLLGIFVNPMVLPANVAGNPHFSDLVAQVQETTASLLTDPDVPFHRLFQHLQSSASPIALGDAPTDFQPVSFNMLNKRNQLALAGLIVERMDFEVASEEDLMFNVRRSRNQLHLHVTYKTKLFTPQRITQMVVHYQNLLAGVV